MTQGGRKVWIGAVLFASCVMTLGAQQMDASYVGGTVMTERNLAGKVTITNSAALEFAGTRPLAIPYEKILSYETSSRNKIHIGLLPEGLWRLAFPWPEAKRVTIVYRDAEETKQVAVLELSRSDEALLVEVLKARVPPPAPRELTPTPRPVPVAGR